jgi:hypothetical protein
MSSRGDEFKQPKVISQFAYPVIPLFAWLPPARKIQVGPFWNNGFGHWATVDAWLAMLVMVAHQCQSQISVVKSLS